MPKPQCIPTPMPSARNSSAHARRIRLRSQWISSRNFPTGDRVRSRNIHPTGHTRLPRYARGKHGTVTNFYGIYNLQDAELPAGCATRQQPLYAVRFDAAELWGSAAETKSAVYLDMWESYLEPA